MDFVQRDLLRKLIEAIPEARYLQAMVDLLSHVDVTKLPEPVIDTVLDQLRIDRITLMENAAALRTGRFHKPEEKTND